MAPVLRQKTLASGSLRRRINSQDLSFHHLLCCFFLMFYVVRQLAQDQISCCLSQPAITLTSSPSMHTKPSSQQNVPPAASLWQILHHNKSRGIKTPFICFGQ